MDAKAKPQQVESKEPLARLACAREIFVGPKRQSYMLYVDYYFPTTLHSQTLTDILLLER